MNILLVNIVFLSLPLRVSCLTAPLESKHTIDHNNVTSVGAGTVNNLKQIMNVFNKRKRKNLVWLMSVHLKSRPTYPLRISFDNNSAIIIKLDPMILSIIFLFCNTSYEN